MPVTVFKVPTSTVASLIGSKGQKVADINESSGASVSFDTTNADLMFTTAYIHGSEEQARIAIAIIKTSVLHARAADLDPTHDEDDKDLVKNAKFDLNTFAVETAQCAFLSRN